MTATTIDRLNGINEGVAVKAPVRAATTANVTLSGEQTIDGIALVTGDRVLVKNQTATANNGIYTVRTTAWTRTLDFDGTRDIVQGTLVYVINGTANSNKFYQVSTASPVIGSALSFTPSQVTAVATIANVMDYGAIGDGTLHTLAERYATLAEAQVVYSFADSLTNSIDWCAIQKALNTGLPLVYLPRNFNTSNAGYVFNKDITLPFTQSVKRGIVHIYGDGSNNFGSKLIRSVSAATIKCIGVSRTTAPNDLYQYLRLTAIRVDGGWGNPNPYNTSADYPLIEMNSVYEAIGNDVFVTNCLGHGMLIRELWDSRLHDFRVTVCGQHNGYNRSLTMTSGSTTATMSDTTGLFKGQVIFGTGLSRVKVSSITNSTTIVLSTAANFTGTRTVVFEAKAAIHICSNNTTDATSNNIVMDGWRIETFPSCGIRIEGSNIVDMFFSDMKLEAAQQSLDYFVDVDTASGVYFGGASNWLYSAPTNYSRMSFPFTTAGNTLASIASATLFSPTIPNMYLVDNGTMTLGSANMTGLADTSTLKIGQTILNTGATSGSGTVTVASIVGATEITMNVAANAAMEGTKSVTFQYMFDSGNFNLKMFYSGMSVVVYDRDDTRNYALARVVSYTPSTGDVTLYVDTRYVFGDTSKSITNWQIAACQAGLVRYRDAKLCAGYFTGGYQGSADITTVPYINSFIHRDGINDLNTHFDITAGFENLPLNSWQAQISTSSNTIGTGAKTFTIATGLNSTMFAAGAAVYISQNTQSAAQNNMQGTITSYTSGTGALVVNITSVKGSGTFTNWNINFAPGTIYCDTGTNTDILGTYSAPTFGCPANFATAIYPVVSDITKASGSVAIRNKVAMTAALYASITKDSQTEYTISDTGKIYLGSTLVGAASTPGVDYVNGFRLTLTTNVPVTITDVTAATTVYATPYKSNAISLYSSGAWTTYSSAQMSLALGTITNDQGYDVFCYNNAGTPTLELLAWTNNTTRATALAYQDGVLVKSGDATRRYLGSFLTTSTTTTEDSLTNRYLYNYYNRIPRLMQRVEATASWNYTTATYREANGSTSNRLKFFIGVVEDTVMAQLNVRCANSSGSIVTQSGIGLNSTTTASITTTTALSNSIAGGYMMHQPNIECLPIVGKNYLAWLEYSNATGTTTWEGSGTFGIQGKVLA